MRTPQSLPPLVVPYYSYSCIPLDGSLKIALPVSRWIQNYPPPLKAQLKDGLPHCISMVFPACVAKLHTSAKRFDRTRNPFKLLFSNNIFV
jgi:hypothetical protein